MARRETQAGADGGPLPPTTVVAGSNVLRTIWLMPMTGSTSLAPLNSNRH